MPEQALLDAYCIMHATFSARLCEGSETLVSSRAQWEALVPRCQDSGTGTGLVPWPALESIVRMLTKFVLVARAKDVMPALEPLCIHSVFG